MQELVGFFIIEAHILRTTPDFRSQGDVDELWDEMCKRIVEVVGQGLKGCGQPEVFLDSKTKVLLFVQTLEVSCSAIFRWKAECHKGYGYNITELNGLLITLFERYSELLLRKFSTDFDEVSHCNSTALLADAACEDRFKRRLSTHAGERSGGARPGVRCMLACYRRSRVSRNVRKICGEWVRSLRLLLS